MKKKLTKSKNNTLMSFYLIMLFTEILNTEIKHVDQKIKKQKVKHYFERLLIRNFRTRILNFQNTFIFLISDGSWLWVS